MSKKKPGEKSGQKLTGYEPCCPQFDPRRWDEKELLWKDKLFIRGDVFCILHAPLTMGRVITRLWHQALTVKAEPELDEFLILSYEASPWKSEQYMAVTREVPHIANVKLSGTFLTKVFEGSYRLSRRWHRQMYDYVKDQGRTPKRIFFYYTTCPRCAKYYKKNYVVVVAEV